MKTNPEIIITNDCFKPERFPVFISGNDETYIKKVEEFFIQKCIENGFSSFNKLEKINDYKESSSLFDEKLVNILYSTGNVGEEEISLLNENGGFLIISAKTNPKDKKLKKIFKDKSEYLLVECYKLNRQSKSKILNNFFDKKEITLEKEIYWYLLESLDDRYAFLSEELEKIFLAGSKINDISFLKKILVSSGSEDMQKIFFNIYEKNDKLLKIYNSCIFSSQNLYAYIARLKFFINIINESSNSDDALSKFPRYLFAEKDLFLKIYKSIGLNKKILINRLLFKAEKLTRICPEHYHSIGLRLTFNLKKIITS